MSVVHPREIIQKWLHQEDDVTAAKESLSRIRREWLNKIKDPTELDQCQAMIDQYIAEHVQAKSRTETGR